MTDAPKEPLDKPELKNWLNKLIHTFYHHDIKSKSELLKILQSAEHKKLIDHEAMRMIEGVLNVSKMSVGDIMIPRSQMVVLKIGSQIAENLPIMIESTHSRFPVVAEDKDHVVGILLAKDLLKYFARHETDDLLLQEHFLRPAVFVPESKRLDSLLKEFRLSHNHLAIVVDEYGNVSGVVTIEDVLEQIVGDIEDEFDVAENPLIQAKGHNTYSVDALTLIEDFNDYFHSDFSDERIDTIGGLLLEHCGYVPKVDESFTIGDFIFKVIEASPRHLNKVLLTRIHPKTTD